MAAVNRVRDHQWSMGHVLKEVAMQVGVIGLGAMGNGMAANLAAAGLLAGVWNRTQSKAAAFAAEHGVTHFADPAALAAAVDVVITSVSADADLLEVIESLHGALSPGTVVVDTSTVAPETAVRAAERLRSGGGELLDAPVSGGPEGACQGSLVMMVGGEAEVLERIRPLLDPISRAVYHMGPVGTGQATKAVNQIAVAGVMQGVAAGLAYARQQGLDVGQVVEVIGGGAASSWQLVQRGPNVAQEHFPPGFKLQLHRKDLEIVRAALRARGCALELIERTLADYDALIEQGYADEDISALYRLRRDELAALAQQ
nr:NAD(P)-dependent oxidoreductase [Halorhodospira abdelmalekii]